MFGPSKKNIVRNLILDEKIDVLCLQETEIEINLDHNLMSFPGYNYENENSPYRRRVGCYVNSNLKYVRRIDLEGNGLHLIIFDIKTVVDLRVINVYRSFNPPNNGNPRDYFLSQLEHIRNAYTQNTILMGDFNLDIGKKGSLGYAFNKYFEDLDNVLAQCDLIQLVNFPTWSRVVNGAHRESIIDHIYTSCPTSCNNICSTTPYFGDHKMILLNFDATKQTPVTSVKRNWSSYTREKLCEHLALSDWSIEDDSVQSYWNLFENRLINIVDIVAPLTEFPCQPKLGIKLILGKGY